MRKINCLIVDDEEPARNLVEHYVNRLPHLLVVAKCANPLEAIQVLQDKPVDLMFLDIQMPELTGVEFLKTLPQKPLVIFTTAYKDYALEGYELNVVDYLLKPFRFERFLQAVNKAGELLKKDDRKTVPSTLAPAQEKHVNTKHYILVKSDFKVYRILHEDIIYIESMKEYVAFHTSTGRILSLGSLKKLQEELPAEHFMRIHKSYIANINGVGILEGNMVHVGGEKLPVGPSYRTEVLHRLF